MAVQYNQNTQQNTASQTQEQGQSRICKYCGATLEEDQMFCGECGQKVDGEEKICPICNSASTSDFCPHCGYKIVPTICPSCGHESHSDFCENCGTVLNPQLEEVYKENEKLQVEVMSEEKAQALEKEFEESKTASLKKFMSKIQEHQILLEEREFFNKREKRIIKFFGQNPMEFQVLSDEEQSFIMKAYSALEEVVIEEQEKALKEDLEKKFPPLDQDPVYQQKVGEINANLEKDRQDLERRFKEIMANVTSSVEKAKEEEKKRLEEERLRREAEERRRREEAERLQAKLRAEQKARDDLVLGTYVAYGGRSVGYMRLSSRSGSYVSGDFVEDFGSEGKIYSSFRGSINGDRIRLSCYSTRTTLFGGASISESFLGTMGGTTTIEGAWIPLGTYRYLKY